MTDQTQDQGQSDEAAAAAGADSQAASSGAETQAAAAGTDSIAAGAGNDVIAAPERPEGLADEFWDPAKGVKLPELLAALKANADKLAPPTDLPATPEGYELAPSADVKVPEGYAVEIDKTDPFFVEVTKTAHERGWGQAAVQPLVDAFARQLVRVQETAVETFAAEKAKLGDRADARIEAVRNGLVAKGAGSIAESLYTAEQIEAAEKLMQLGTVTSPHNPGATPQADDAGRVWFPNSPSLHVNGKR